MLAAVLSRPSIATPGRPTPIGASSGIGVALASRRTSRTIDALTLSGVDGVSVGTRRRSERISPESTSTTAALMPLPPTSTPNASRPPSPDPVDSVMACLSEVVDGDAAVDDERRAVRPAGFVRGEVDGHVHDLVRLPEPAGRVACQPDALRLLVLDEPVHEQRRLDRPRADRVRPD